MKIDAKNEASDEHIEKVCQLTISDVMELSNNNLIPNNLVDDLYYYLLDNKAIREKLWWNIKKYITSYLTKRGKH